MKIFFNISLTVLLIPFQIIPASSHTPGGFVPASPTARPAPAAEFETNPDLGPPAKFAGGQRRAMKPTEGQVRTSLG